jgi:hypothetical protein
MSWIDTLTRVFLVVSAVVTLASQIVEGDEGFYVPGCRKADNTCGNVKSSSRPGKLVTILTASCPNDPEKILIKCKQRSKSEIVIFSDLNLRQRNVLVDAFDISQRRQDAYPQTASPGQGIMVNRQVTASAVL